MTNAPERGTPQYDEVVAILAAKARTLHAHEYAEQQRNHLRSEGYDLDCVCGGCTVCTVRPYIDLVDPPQPTVGHRPPCTNGDYCGEPAHCPPAARQTTGIDTASDTAQHPAARQTTGQDDTAPLPPRAERCPEPGCAEGRECWRCDYEESQHAARQPDPTTADNPVPLRWGLGDILHGDDDTTIVCLSGLDREPYWLELDPERAAAFRRDLTPPAAEDTIGLCGYCGVPRENHHHGYTSTADVIAASPYSRTDAAPALAVGQPAEAHDTDRAALRERLRLAIAQQYLDETGSGRTIGELDDTEFGSLADAALSALTVEGER